MGCSGGGDVMLLNFLNVKDLGGSLLGSQLDGLDLDLPASYSTKSMWFAKNQTNKFTS